MKDFKLIKNRAGMSLVEVLVVLGIMGIVAAGITSLITNLYKSQNQANVVATLTTLKTNITNLILDGNSWANTIYAADNTSLSCLKSPEDGGGPCTAAVNVRFNSLRDGTDDPANNLFYNNPNGTSSNGFTADGRTCNTFNATTGNDNCPIQYRFFITFECVGGSPCENPMLTVKATLVYAPTPGNKMRSVVNPEKYSVEVRRGTGLYTRNEVVYITHESTTSTGGGVCPTGTTWAPRTLNTVKEDVGGNVVSTGTVVRLKAGTYTCDAGVKGFSVLTYAVRVRIDGVVDSNLIRSGLAPQTPATQTETVIYKFQVMKSSDFDISLEQNCESSPIHGDPASFGMGLPIRVAGSYSNGTVFAFLACVRQF